VLLCSRRGGQAAQWDTFRERIASGSFAENGCGALWKVDASSFMKRETDPGRHRQRGCAIIISR
jgi:hypothetical protein